jgi:DedD protein
MSDEGVHEIQLNGKQLVFMFMAVTVVAVVIFLCGVMVGRGVRAPRATELAGATIETPIDPTAPVQTPSAAPADTSSPAAPAPAPERLTYSDRLSEATPPPETLKEPVATEARTSESKTAEPRAAAPRISAPKTSEAKPAAAVKASTPPPPVPAAAARTTSKPAAARSTSEPTGAGYVVQVAAVKARGEADTIAKRLASKGFPSFVTTPSAGAAGVYRVRVGKYSDRREAESVARRLEKEEQFKPWITR